MLLGESGGYAVERRAKDRLQSLHQKALSLAPGNGTWRRNARDVSESLLLSLFLLLLRERMWPADDWDLDQNPLWRRDCYLQDVESD